MVEELDQVKEQLRQASDAPPKVQGRIKELKAMNTRLWQDGVDLQHAQRAAERDRDNARKKGIQPLAESLLPCVDSLERALASPPQDGDEVLREGLQMTLGDPEKALDSHDINPTAGVAAGLEDWRAGTAFCECHCFRAAPASGRITITTIARSKDLWLTLSA